MNLTHQQLLEAKRNGAGVKIVKKAKPMAMPAMTPDEPEPSMMPDCMEKFMEAVIQIPALLAALGKREAPAVNVDIEAAKAPSVQVNAPVQVNTPRVWNVEVTERTRDQRIKKLTIKAAD